LKDADSPGSGVKLIDARMGINRISEQNEMVALLDPLGQENPPF